MPPTSQIDRLSDYLARQAKRAAEALRQTLYSAVISAGGLRIQDGGDLRVENEDGINVFVVGRQLFGDVLYQGVVIRRPTGDALFYTAPVDGNPSVIRWFLRDRSASTVVSDGLSGFGLSRPFLAMPIQNTQYESMPSTDNSNWSSLQESWVPRQHQMWTVRWLYTSTEAATTGEVRLRIGSSVVATATVGFGLQADFHEISGTGSHMSVNQITLEARRTSGTGRISASMLGWGQG